MRTKIEHFLSGLNTKVDVLCFVDVDNIDRNNPFDSIYQMIEDNGGFDIEIIPREEFCKLKSEINDFFEKLEEEEKIGKNPSIGQFVFDVYCRKRRKVQGISGKLYFIGAEQEPVFRDEFIFPLPKK
mgnify:FL=1